jgi:hypothetical protein
MPDPAEHPPGTSAPVSGRYRLHNVFGSPLAHVAHVRAGEPLPPAPIAHTWLLDGVEDE